MSAAVLAWAAVLAGSLLWNLSAASRAGANPPRVRAGYGQRGWLLQQGLYAAGYFLVLLGVLTLQRAQGWSALPPAVLVWLGPLAVIALVHRRRARCWAAGR